MPFGLLLDLWNVIDNTTALQSQNELLALTMLFLMGFDYSEKD